MAGYGQDSDSLAKGKGSGPWAKGLSVQFFHAVDPADHTAALVSPGAYRSGRPLLLQSHGWLDGTLTEQFDPTKLDANDPKSWPLVAPHQELHFLNRACKRPSGSMDARRVLHIRKPSTAVPELSVTFVRWNGEVSKKEEEPNDGDWGRYGAPTSDEYMTALVEKGILAHPKLAGKDTRSFELFHLLVASSRDVSNINSFVPHFARLLKGKRQTCFWMVWPGEWMDFDDPDYACYIARQPLFGAMRACEAGGLRSGFPHTADLYELITSKTWMATLSLDPFVRLPAGTLVTKESVVLDAKAAAENALNTLEHIRQMNPFVVGPDEPAAPSEVNKGGIRKGVVKVGFSWENRFVLTFSDLEQLQRQLTQMMNQEGCYTSHCLVQEWVDFDFEMRLYFLPPQGKEWAPGAVLEPARIECNGWGEFPNPEHQVLGQSNGSFSKLPETTCIKKWEGDTEAWEAAKKQAVEMSQRLLAWLRTASSQAVPMVRLDFMAKRIGPGKARLHFGEYCEMGACCLGWQDGPPTIWRAALDAALK